MDSMADPPDVGDSTDEIEAVDFYTRPGCPFSGALSRSMKKWGIPMVRHDIWSDEEAAQQVRRAAKGNETVPTIGIGNVMLVNPHLGEVIEALKVGAPHLVPEGPPNSLWRRATQPFRRG